MQSWLEGRIWVGKGAQATGMTASLRILSSKADSTLWGVTRSGLKLESVHQESPHSDVFRKRATSHFWTRDNVRSVLPGLWRKRTGLLLSGPKSSFLPCYLLVLVHCVFWVHSQRSHLPGNFRALHASFCWQLYGDADFIFQQDLAPAHTAKSTKSWLNDHGVGVLDWPAISPDLNPIENLSGIVKRKMRDPQCRTWTSIPPQQCHKLITSMPRRIEAVIKAKGAPTSIEYIYSKLTYFPEGQQFTKMFFLLVLWSILICWDCESWVFVKFEPKSSQLKESKT